MNLLDAIKSGRRFRRKRWVEDFENVGYAFYTDYDRLSEEDVLAEDWEVEELDSEELLDFWK